MTKKKASKDGSKKERLTILPGVGLVGLDDPAVVGKLAERLAGKVGEQLVLFAQRMQEGLLAASVAIGLEVMAEFMEADATEVAGPKGKHNAGRAAYCHGHDDATVTLGGRRLAASRPRVRSVEGTEVHPRVLRHLRLHRPAHRPDHGGHDGRAVHRRYEGALEPVGAEVARRPPRRLGAR